VNEVHITKEVLIAYTIGNLKDEMLCGMLPMDAYHVLLGRLWHFDKGAIYHEKPKNYSFKVQGRSYTLASLPPI